MNNLPTNSSRTKDAVEYVQAQFNIKEGIQHLNTMMKEVTKGGYSAENVNAACNCVGKITDIINTTIHAANFIKKHND